MSVANTNATLRRVDGANESGARDRDHALGRSVLVESGDASRADERATLVGSWVDVASVDATRTGSPLEQQRARFEWKGPKTVLHKLLDDQGVYAEVQLCVFGLYGRALFCEGDDGLPKTGLYYEGTYRSGKNVAISCLTEVANAAGLQHVLKRFVDCCDDLIVPECVRDAISAVKQPRALTLFLGQHVYSSRLFGKLWDGRTKTVIAKRRLPHLDSRPFRAKADAIRYEPLFLCIQFPRGIIDPLDLSARITSEVDALLQAYRQAYSILLADPKMLEAADAVLRNGPKFKPIGPEFRDWTLAIAQ
eukprot:tig00021072_g17969.t1